MNLADFGILFSAGLAVGMILVAIAQLIAVTIKLFKKIVNG